jgi:hypothetical protein
MEQHEAPAAERLIDHAWMVDCALLLHDRTGAAVAAERLFDELVLHDRAFERTRFYLDPYTAEELATTALALRAGVRLLTEELRLGTSSPRPALRSQVEKLILAEAAAVGDCASVHVD